MAMLGEGPIEISAPMEGRQAAYSDNTVEVTILLDRSIIEHFKSAGADWKQRLEATLRKAEVR